MSAETGISSLFGAVLGVSFAASFSDASVATTYGILDYALVVFCMAAPVLAVARFRPALISANQNNYAPLMIGCIIVTVAILCLFLLYGLGLRPNQNSLSPPHILASGALLSWTLYYGMLLSEEI